MYRWKNTKLENVDVSRLKRNIPAYTVLILAVGAMTFFGVCTPAGRQMVGPAGVAGSVGDEDITALEFRRAHITQSQQYQQQFKGNFDPVRMGLSAQVLNQLIQQLALYQEAYRNGLVATDSEVEQVILDGEYFRNENGQFDAEQFRRYLSSQGFTEASFTEYLRRNLVTSKLRSFVTSTYQVSHKAMELEYRLAETKLNVAYVALKQQNADVSISDDEVQNFLAAEDNLQRVKDYYQANQQTYNQEKQVKARHILVAFEGARRATGDAALRSKEEARKRAERILEEVRSGDQAFVALAKNYTDEPGGQQKGGDLGYFKKETMVKAFSDVAFGMKPGEVSQVVESPFGFHIIKVEDVKEPKSVSLEQAQPGIARKLLKQEKAPKVLAEKAANVLAAAKEQPDTNLSDFAVEWQQTGEFALNQRQIPGGLGASEALRKAIFSLKQSGEVYPEVISDNGVKYIVKLKSRKDADLSKLTDEKLAEMAETNKFMRAFQLYSHLTPAIQTKYEEAGKIYRNPEFLRYDEMMRGGST